MNVIAAIDAARERWNVLEHPFYVRWERGELTRDELARYAGEYRHAVLALAGGVWDGGG
jgi:pyrroloquinoline-quinone synthase